MIITCPKCKNNSDFRKEYHLCYSWSGIDPDISGGWIHDDDSWDYFFYNEENKGLLIKCNVCDYCFNEGEQIPTEEIWIKKAKKLGWAK